MIRHRVTRTKNVYIVTMCVILLVLGVGSAMFLSLHRDKSSDTMPAELKTLALSSPIYYPLSLPDGYTYKTDSATLDKSILFFTVAKPNGATIYVTEQPTPGTLKTSSVKGSEAVDGAPGSAAISYKEETITATLLSKKGTMVTLTSSGNVSSEHIRDILRALRPLP